MMSRTQDAENKASGGKSEKQEIRNRAQEKEKRDDRQRSEK